MIGNRLPAHKAALYLTHNDHLSVYETVEQWWADKMYCDDDDWVSLEEKAKALESNEVWELRWYPDTPVGFYIRLASTLEAVLEPTQPSATPWTPRHEENR